MAWPLSRFQDFVDNTLPVITAAFLHAVQDAAIKVYDGTQTLKALTVDGGGGSAVAPTAGDITASRSMNPGRTVSGTSVPTTTTVAGELTKGFVPVAWGRVTGTTGALKRGAGLFACTRSAQGVYSVTAHAVLGDAVNFATLVTAEIIGGIVIVAPQAANAGRPVVQITIQVAGANTDANFSFAIFGE